jgi:hypothetical protein
MAVRPRERGVYRGCGDQFRPRAITPDHAFPAEDGLLPENQGSVFFIRNKMVLTVLHKELGALYSIHGLPAFVTQWCN